MAGEVLLPGDGARLLGYGLKFTTGFQHTHLGDLGPSIPQSTP